MDYEKFIVMIFEPAGQSKELPYHEAKKLRDTMHKKSLHDIHLILPIKESE